MQTKNTATRYSKEFRESMISLSQTGRSANSAPLINYSERIVRIPFVKAVHVIMYQSQNRIVDWLKKII